MPPVSSSSSTRRSRPALALLAGGLLALGLAVTAGCASKPAPACEKLKACCDGLRGDPAAYAGTEASKTCDTFVTIYPKDPTTGEVPGEPFCTSLASDLPTSFVKATKPPPAACK